MLRTWKMAAYVNHFSLYFHGAELYTFVEDIDVEGPANSGNPTLMRPPQREFEFLRVRGCITLAACHYVSRGFRVA